MNKWLAALLAALLSGAASIAAAGQFANLSIVNQNTGERLPIWRHEGRNYVAGNPGDRYAIEVKNRIGERILSVVSVDGVNVISGQTASPGQAGYVLGGWDSMEIKGWRKNMDEVAAFYFTQLPDSYAARTGRPDNVGVIGIAVFKEYAEAPIARDQAAPASPMAGARAKNSESADEAKIGTGHGERVASGTRMTEFRRAGSRPNEIITIQYDTRAHLVARGIIPRSHGGPHEHRPVPFPGSFVPDPS